MMSLKIEHNYALDSLLTMRLPVRAKQFIEITNREDLKLFLRKNANEPLYILGGGSNVVFLNDFNGTILHINSLGKEILKEDDNHVWIRAEAGENWHELVLWTLSNNFGGLENLSLIPGKVGASPMQNIGAYGVEIKDVLEEVEAIEIATGEIQKFSKDDCNLGYRESIFKNELKDQFIITAVTYKLTKRNHILHTEYGAIQTKLEELNVKNPTIQDVSAAVIAIRENKLPDPRKIPNCGSFFKNPVLLNEEYNFLKEDYPNLPNYPVNEQQVKIPAAWLIEKAGWKGYRNQHVGVHDKQALVLINYNHGTGKEIYDLSQEIIQDIFNTFGILLQREVNII